MADRRAQYHTNGAAAYDVYAWNQSTAPQRAARAAAPAGGASASSKAAACQAQHCASPPFTVVGMLAVACLLVLVVFGYVQLFEATSEVSKLENQLSALQSQQTQLQSRYEARIDLDAIETAAGDLGLTKPSQEQIVYLDLSGADRAEIYQEEKTSVFSEIVSAMEQSVSGLIAYLRAASA